MVRMFVKKLKINFLSIIDQAFRDLVFLPKH